MAAPSSNVSPLQANAPAPQRFAWTASLTHLLINLWQDHLAELRARKRNAPVYARMTALFNQLASEKCGHAVCVTVKQIKHKMENLAQAHKKASTAGTRSAATQCPFYKRLHTFLGNLPMHDQNLVQESFQLDMVERPPEGAVILASGLPSEATSSPDDGNVKASTSLASTSQSSTSQSSTSHASTPVASAEQGHTRKRRQQTSSIDRVMLLLERQETRAEKMAKKAYKLFKKAVSLQEEANDIHREMVSIIRQYIEGRQERQPDCPDSAE
ncbi:uncharacterized protein LOC119431378 [Dermacentor silvarum]|uniref:uncharacterized protein LOC119431378 n=1 Tax=Dermacentor silvarum TaxID=543639 RepID=UPI001896FE74|nr:uncharacterized protein LOC119431378 [Dermacentor silvarum]